MSDLRAFLSNEQKLKSIENLMTEVNKLLTQFEKIEYVAVQKISILNLKPDYMILTNNRIFFYRPKEIGFQADFLECDWEDISDPNCTMKDDLWTYIFFKNE